MLKRTFPSTTHDDATAIVGDEAYQQTLLQLRWRYVHCRASDAPYLAQASCCPPSLTYLSSCSVFRYLLVHDAYTDALSWCVDAAVPAMLTAYSEALRSRVGTAPELKVLLAIAQAASALVTQRSGSAEVSFV